MKLSKREKIFLYALALMAIVAGITMLLIVPATDRRSELDLAVSDAETSLDHMHAEIANEQNYRFGIAETSGLLEEETEKVLPAMTDSALDRYVTTLVQRKGLLAEELIISAGEEAMPTPSLFTARVKVRASGSLRQFVALAEDVRGTDGIRIAKMQLVRSQSETLEAGMRELAVDVEFLVLEYMDTAGLDRLAGAAPTEG